MLWSSCRWRCRGLCGWHMPEWAQRADACHCWHCWQDSGTSLPKAGVFAASASRVGGGKEQRGPTAASGWLLTSPWRWAPCAGRRAWRAGISSGSPSRPVCADAAHKLHEPNGGGRRGDLTRHARQASWPAACFFLHCTPLWRAQRAQHAGSCPAGPASRADALPAALLHAPATCLLTRRSCLLAAPSAPCALSSLLHAARVLSCWLAAHKLAPPPHHHHLTHTHTHHTHTPAGWTWTRMPRTSTPSGRARCSGP